VDELALAGDQGITWQAKATFDHAHELEALDGRLSRSYRLNAACGSDHSLDPAAYFENVAQALRRQP
jgi:hypothetical protein